MCEDIKIVIENLKKNNINAIYCETKQDVVATVKDMLEPNATVAAGGSVSLQESGVWELINSGDYNFFDRNREGITAEEKQQVFKNTIGIDYYFCSTNAVTVDGELLNVDTVRLLAAETSTEIPAPINALEDAKVRFKEICEKEDMLKAVYKALGI